MPVPIREYNRCVSREMEFTTTELASCNMLVSVDFSVDTSICHANDSQEVGDNMGMATVIFASVS